MLISLLHLALGLSMTAGLPDGSQAAPKDGATFADDMREPGPRPKDTFHPDYQPGENGEMPEAPAPAYGGRIIMHLESMPRGLNRVIENSSVTRNLHGVLHDNLLRRDWETWEYKPRVCESWDTEDMVVLHPDAVEEYRDAVRRIRLLSPSSGSDAATSQREESVVFGRVTEHEGHLMVAPVSRGNPLGEALKVEAGHVQRIERGAVFTFNLRDDVYWHPSPGAEHHLLDARDLVFSWSTYHNPAVDCDQVRYQFLKVTHGEVVDSRTARFFYERQYFNALSSIGGQMMLLPSHVYDLTDPDHPEHDAEATPRMQAEHINLHPRNKQIVGLGPYRVTDYSQEFIEAERFEGYYDPESAGYFDTIRWRYIPDDNTAFQALLNGDIDFFSRVKSADYFGSATKSETFTKQLYSGFFYYPSFSFTAWNTHRPQLADREVRRAIAQAFDFESYRVSLYKGLGVQVTGPFPYVSPAYDHSVERLPFDPDKAIDTLETAGWYDRDGNGVVDKEGVELELTYLSPSGNDASKNIGLKLQESLEVIGIKLSIEQVEWATFSERLQERKFDCANLAWSSPLEDDPEQLWHSRWGGPDVRSSNYSGTRNPTLDKLIEAGQRELDDDKRMALWHRIHRLVYEEQPFMFMYNAPRKFAMNRAVRGMQTFAIRPGYNPLRWYYPEGTPGTRPELQKD